MNLVDILARTRASEGAMFGTALHLKVLIPLGTDGAEHWAAGIERARKLTWSIGGESLTGEEVGGQHISITRSPQHPAQRPTVDDLAFNHFSVSRTWAISSDSAALVRSGARPSHLLLTL